MRIPWNKAGRLNERGVTLAELLAAVSISVMVLGAAVSIVYGIYTMFHKTTSDFELKSEANRIVNAIVSSSSHATSATLKLNEIVFTDDPNLHRIYITAAGGGPQKNLIYDKFSGSQTDTFPLGNHVISLLINGTEVGDIPAGTEQQINGSDANPLITFDITLQSSSETHHFTTTVKLLSASKPTLPVQP